MSETVLVYGVGVIGSVYAVRLAKAGFTVTAIARGDRLDSIRADDLRIRHVFLDEDERAEIEVLERLPHDRRFDIVLVTVRAGQIMDALCDVARCPGPMAVVVIGNNLGDYDAQAALVSGENFVLGFGAFGGYREGGIIKYTDGRTVKKPGAEQRSRTTLGLLSSSARPALAAASAVLVSAGLPCVESRDVRSWLACHAALVFPLAGAIYAAGGEQEKVCRTRDAIVIGVRACKELFTGLRSTGYLIEPKRLGRMIAMPEWSLVRMLSKVLGSESARVAMFGHANAVRGRDEIGGQVLVLDAIARRSGLDAPSWDRLLPYFSSEPRIPFIPDRSRAIRMRLW